MLKPPFTAKHGLSGVWIEDGNGVTICDMSLLLDPDIAFTIAELLAAGANQRLHQAAVNKQNAKNAGRPKIHTSNPKTLYQRTRREKLKAIRENRLRRATKKKGKT